MSGSITDVSGILVGHHHRLDPDATLGAGWACGTTVVLVPPGTTGAVDVRGGAPGTRETDLLDPANSVRFLDAVVLTGGSAYGLAAADGVMQWLEQHDRGAVIDGGLVPIVPAAVIFDLPVGGWQCRPTAEFGLAAAAAAGVDVPIGTVGAGVGARAGVLKGGIGTASIRLDDIGVTVGALVAVNSAGNVADPRTGLPWQVDVIAELNLTAPPAEQIAAFGARDAELSPFNTTIAVVATDAALSKPACKRVAIAAQDGLARTIRPSHTPLDGDTVFALSTSAVEVAPAADTPAAMSPETELMTRIGAAAADCLARAVLVGVLAADPVAGIPTYRDVLPGAFGGAEPTNDEPTKGGDVLTIRRDLVEAMVAHARADHPDEACGVIAGPVGTDRPERFIAMANAERSPTFYRFDSGEHLVVWRAMDDGDEAPVVVYHSHTGTEAYPSRTDVDIAAEPDAHYVLISTRDPAEHELRSYRIVDGTVTEEPVTVVEQYQH